MGVLRALQGFQGTIGQPTAQVIDGSLKFDSASSQYLSSTSTFQNSKSYEMTFSFWLKRCAPTAVKETQYIYSSNVEGTMFFDNGHSDQIGFNLRGSSGSNFFTYTSAKLRDFDAWYHVVVALNLGSGTQSQRFKCYINNVEQTMTNTSYPSNAYHTGGTWYIGAYQGGPSHFPDYYLSNFYCISGQVLDPSYFGFTDPQTNTWRPKKYTGTFTFDNSFYLPLDNEDDFGKDKSGEENHFTQNNFSGTSIDPDVVKDSPSGAVFGGRGQTGITTTSSAPSNYCTWNPLTRYAGANYTLSEGNLKAVKSGGNVVSLNGTIGVSYGDGGKFYYEADHNSSPTQGQAIGWGNDQYFTYTYGTGFTKRLFYKNTTVTYSEHDVSSTNIATGLTSNFGKTLGVAFDLDENTMSFYVDGVLQATATGVWGTYFDTTDRLFPFLLGDGTGNNGTIETNFGQKPFKYAPPQGYLPLNSASVRPNKVVPRPDQYVEVTTYVGTGNGTTYTDTSLKFKPDMTWFKRRDGTVNHVLYDSVRGYGDASKAIRPNNNGVESAFGDAVVTAKDNGFSVTGSNTTGINGSGEDIVCWAWKAGGSKNTFNVDDVGYATAAAAGLTGGDITPTGASVGTKQGFSIIKYTGSGTSGDTLPHGLSQTPDLIITKCLDASSIDWIVKPVGLLSSESHMLILNDLNAEFQGTGGHISAQTSTTVTLTEGSNDGNYNNSGDNYIMYSWHNVPGLQKFGKYTGNNSSDGPYVELGFRPAIVWIKGLDFAANWFGFDNERNGINPTQHYLYLDRDNGGGTYDAASTAVPIDFLSNGFKVRFGTAGYINNTSSYEFIYCAWAEQPASNLFGGQSNAR